MYVGSLVVFEPNSFHDLLIIDLAVDSTISYCALISLRDYCNLMEISDPPCKCWISTFGVLIILFFSIGLEFRWRAI